MRNGSSQKCSVHHSSFSFLLRGSPLLLQDGVLSPQGHRSCYQDTASPWASHRLSISSRHSPAPLWAPPWAAGGFLSPCSSSCPSFSTYLGVCKAVPLTQSHVCCNYLCAITFLFLSIYIIAAVLASFLNDPALASPILEMFGIFSAGHGGNFQQLLVAPLYQNLARKNQ